MLIRCPTCASGYELPPHLLSEGRILRCAHCRDAWALQGTLAEVPPATLSISVEVRSARQTVPSPHQPRPRPHLARRGLPRIGTSTAAAVLLFATLASGMAAVGQRERLVAAYRPSAALFATIGLPVNLRGLALKDIHSTLGSADGAPLLTLEGTITNLRQRETAIPAIRIAVRDAGERELYAWTAPAPKRRLAAGEAVPFQSRLATPPRDGETLSVSFVDVPPAPRHLAEASSGGR